MSGVTANILVTDLTIDRERSCFAIEDAVVGLCN